MEEERGERKEEEEEEREAEKERENCGSDGNEVLLSCREEEMRNDEGVTNRVAIVGGGLGKLW